MGTIAVTGWFALAPQFTLSINKFVAAGRTLTGSVIQILSYFTILTNLLVALSLTLVLFKPLSRLAVFFTKPTTATATAI
jgi:hypothetical protein